MLTTDGVTGKSVEDVSRCRGCVEAMRRAMCRACVEPDVEDVEAWAQGPPRVMLVARSYPSG